MKILLIDDDAIKLGKLISVLTECGLSRDDIDVSRSAMDARGKLRKTRYEIAVLDLLLPNRDEEPEHLQVSLDLLREMHERDEYFKPQRLIGFTAFTDAATQATPEFGRTLWTIVVYDETGDGWQEQFRRTVAYVRSAASKHDRPSYGLDLCLITALQTPELSAIHQLPWDWEPSEPMDDSTFVRFGRFQDTSRSYRVVSACAPRMGNVAAALLTARLIDRYRPRFVVMAGICAGVRQKVNLGDVILFSPSWEWASGKLISDGDEGSYLEPAPHQIAVPEFVLARAEELRKDKNFWMKLKDSFPIDSDVLPKLVSAPGASGPSVIAHKDSTDAIKVQHRKLTAIDMEVYGVSAAAHSASSPRPTAFAMKAACDFADEEKDGSMQGYAAYVSARAIQGFFERYMGSIYELAGG